MVSVFDEDGNTIVFCDHSFAAVCVDCAKRAIDKYRSTIVNINKILTDELYGV